MINALNEIRRRAGLAPLTANAQLAEAARRHVADLASGRVDLSNSHIGSDGSTVGDRVAATGYRAAVKKEITGWGWGTWDEAAQIMYWLNSPPHRLIIFNPNVTEVGIAYLEQAGAWTQYTRWWVVVFARPVGVTLPPEPPISPPETPKPPHVVHVPIVVGGREIPPRGPVIDLLAYLRGDGRSYRVGNAGGSFEVFQTQTEGDTFYQVKAWDDLSVVHWEQFEVSGDTIGRDVDTSPGGGRFYRQFGAPWVRRFMAVGETFTQQKRLQFYRLEDCQPVEAHSGTVTDSIKLVAHHSRYTFPARDWPAVTLDDVIELEWLQGGEVYWFARSFGLVGWSRRHQDPHSPAWSAISEMRPHVGVLERLRVGCL